MHNMASWYPHRYAPLGPLGWGWGGGLGRTARRSCACSSRVALCPEPNARYNAAAQLPQSQPLRVEPSGPVVMHAAGLPACRADPSVLWLHYEDLHEDLPAAVRLIAEFLGIGVDDAGKLLGIARCCTVHDMHLLQVWVAAPGCRT